MKGKREAFLGLFWAYAIAAACLLFGRAGDPLTQGYWYQAERNLNLRPFETVQRYLRLLNGDYGWELWWHAAVNLAGNVVLFVPLGFLTPMLWQGFRPAWRCVLWCAAIIVAVELTQLVTLVGSCDVDDLILNLLGVLLGYGLYKFPAKTDRK